MTDYVGSTGRELLLEMQRGDRSRNSDRDGTGVHLPSYSTKLVRAAFEELQDAVRSLSQEVRAAQTNAGDAEAGELGMEVRPSILLHNATIQRQKRCLLAYHKVRMDRIRQRIVLGDGLVASSESNHGQTMSEAESEFAQDYRQLRMQYASATNVELDLLPPTSRMVQVRVLAAQGEIVLESGRTVNLSQGSLHYLPRSDVQPFLRVGAMELVDGEEVDS